MFSWFQREVVDEGKLPLFLCLVAFLLTFVATRVITRLIRAGKGPFKDNVSEGGLHVHHAVPGMFLLIIGAFRRSGLAPRALGRRPPRSSSASAHRSCSTSSR